MRYANPAVIKVALDQQRRLHLPKYLNVCTPFTLFEFDKADGSTLGISNTASLQEMRSEGDVLNELMAYRSLRFTVPQAICDKHALTPKASVVLLTMDRWISIWSEARWEADFYEAMSGTLPKKLLG